MYYAIYVDGKKSISTPIKDAAIMLAEMFTKNHRVVVVAKDNGRRDDFAVIWYYTRC